MIAAKGVGILPTKKLLVTNRTGGALVVGGYYAVDVTGGATESTSADTNLTNLVAAATANLRGIGVIATEAAADDADTVVTLTGRVSALVDGTTDVVEGDRLIAQNASPNLIKQAGLFPGVGFALEAQATNAGTLTDIFFDGWGLWKSELAAS